MLPAWRCDGIAYVKPFFWHGKRHHSPRILTIAGKFRHEGMVSSYVSDKHVVRDFQKLRGACHPIVSCWCAALILDIQRELELRKSLYCDLNAADVKARLRETEGMSLSEASLRSRPPSARELLATNIVRLRKEKGWSQEDLALEAGLHRTFVAHVERHARNISLDNIERLANALQVNVHILLLP